METFTKFLYDFLGQFLAVIILMIQGFFKGIKQTFNIPAYVELFNKYKTSLNKPEWVLVVIALIIVAIIIFLIVAVAVLLARKKVKFNKRGLNQDALLDEVATLNNKVVDLMKEKDELMAMKVSQLGLAPDESSTIDTETGASKDENGEKVDGAGLRFPKLVSIDEKYADSKIIDHTNTFTLPELCEAFRNFAASRLKLYYNTNMMRLFIAALASTKLVILQGISGTGKTSLAYAWGKFNQHDSCVASVQPSWRDRTELFGYFNEFTKKFNETEVLAEIYKAGYSDDIFTVILDEMNIARVEYYFAEMLSILEMPNKDEWIVELVPSAWQGDPKHLFDGKIKLSPNLWYIGTINNDDSTFMVTDKVYDRAMPIDINDKGQPFDPVDTDPWEINYTYLDKLFQQAMQDYPVSESTMNKIEQMDNYVIEHFRIAFGNRIVMQIGKFVPVYVGCGGDEIDGVDYFLARKVLRKFEQLNVAYIRDEIDPYIDFLNKTFGKDKMHECIEFMLRLKKLT